MDILNYAATNIQRMARGHLVRQHRQRTIDQYIPDFFDPHERLSTPVIPTELLLPLRLRREECLFKVDLIYDHVGKPYCFIFVEDDKMKMYTLVEPMESVVGAFGKIPDFDIDDEILSNFLDRYEDLSPQHWETILDLENLHEDRRKRKLVIKKDLDKLRPRLYMSKKISRFNQNTETADVEEDADIIEDLMSEGRPSSRRVETPGVMYVRDCIISNIKHRLSVKVQNDGVVIVHAEDLKSSYEYTLETSKQQLLQAYYTALPHEKGKRLDQDLLSLTNLLHSGRRNGPKDPSLKLHEVLENVLILELKNKDRRRRELKLRNSPRRVRNIPAMVRASPSNIRKRGRGNNPHDNAYASVGAENSGKTYVDTKTRFELCQKYGLSLSILDNRATIIQKHVRRYRHRHNLAWKRETIAFQKEHKLDIAALKIQRLYRGHNGRARALRTSGILQLIQTMSRYKKYRPWTPGVGSFDFFFTLLELDATAGVDEEYFLLNLERLERSAIVIQAYFRRYQKRHLLRWREEKRSVAIFLKTLKSEPSIEALLDDAAQTIQRFARMVIARRRFRHIFMSTVEELARSMHRASITIQRVARGMLGRKRFKLKQELVYKQMEYDAENDEDFRIRSLYTTFPVFENQRPWTPGAKNDWVVLKAASAAIKIQCLYRSYKAIQQVATMRQMLNIKRLAENANFDENVTQQAAVEATRTKHVSWDFLWDFELLLQEDSSSTDNAALVIQRTMRRALAIKKVRWRKQLVEAKKRNRIKKEMERPPSSTTGRKIGKQIFSSLSNGTMTKKSVLRSVFENTDKDDYSNLRSSLHRCALQMAPLSGLLSPKRYKKTLDLIDRAGKGKISERSFVQYSIGSPQLMTRPNTPIEFKLPPLPKAIPLKFSPEIGVEVVDEDTPEDFTIGIKPTPATLAYARIFLEETSEGYQKLLFAQRRRRWVRKNKMLPADRLEKRAAARMKCLPMDTYPTQESFIDRIIIRAIVRSTLLPVGSPIAFENKQNTVTRVISRYTTKLKLLPSAMIEELGSNKGLRGNMVKSQMEHRHMIQEVSKCLDMVIEKVEQTCTASDGVLIGIIDALIAEDVEAFVTNERANVHLKNTKLEKIKRMFKRPAREKKSSPPAKKTIKPKLTEKEMKRLARKRLKESMKRKKNSRAAQGKKKRAREDFMSQTKSPQTLIGGSNGSSKIVKSKFKRKGKHPRSTVTVDKVFDWMANPVPRSQDHVENDVSGSLVPNKDGISELVYARDHLPDIEHPNISNLSGISYEENRLASVARIGRHREAPYESDEDEPLIGSEFPAKQRRAIKTKNRVSKHVASDVLNIYESEETLKLLVEALETSDTKAAKEDLERWERGQERRERVVTPKLPKLRSIGQSPGQSNIRFDPIVRSEKKTRNGIIEEWHVEATLPNDRLTLEHLQQKRNKTKKGKNKGYLKMISKLRKQRRLNNYASVYSMPVKETLSPRSPRQKVADLNRTLEKLEETKLGDVGVNEGKEVVDPTVNLYRKAWLLRQQQREATKGQK